MGPLIIIRVLFFSLRSQGHRHQLYLGRVWLFIRESASLGNTEWREAGICFLKLGFVAPQVISLREAFMGSDIPTPDWFSRAAWEGEEALGLL